MISAKNIVILFIGLAIIYTDEHSLLFQHVYTYNRNMDGHLRGVSTM